MTEKRGKYTLEVPLDASAVGDLQADEQQDLRVVAKDSSGATRSTVVNMGKERQASARLDFEGPPGALTVFVGPASATDEELLQSQTISVDIGKRRWADRTRLAIAPIVIAPYWWFWWLRWCREFVIRGRVVCPDGSPVPGATVCALDVDWWFLWSSTQQVGCATTDVNGAFEIRFRWCCGYWPWWWWKNRVWTLDDVLVERVGDVLAAKPDLQLGRIGNRPSLEAFGGLLAERTGGPTATLEAADAPALAGLREDLLAKLPQSPELARLHVWPWWPWWPWWDCTPDIIFKVTQECEGGLVTIVDETVADTRWDVANPLSVTLVANDACCRPHDGGGDECLVLDSVCGISLASVGGNPGAPAGLPDGYAVGDRPFAGTATITKNPGDLLGVDYVELEMFDAASSTWVPAPAGAELGFNRHYWEPGGTPQHIYPAFPVLSMSGHRVWETREHHEAASGATWFPDAGWTRVWMSSNYSLIAYIDTNMFGDGTYTFRVMGWQDGGGGTLTNPKVIPVCGEDDENRFVLTFDNRVITAVGHDPSHNCGAGVHTCTLEPDTHISEVRIGGVSIDPCDIGKPEGEVEIFFEVSDPDGHLSHYSLIGTYGLNQEVDLLPLGTITALSAGTQEGPTYGQALAQGATSPHWSGGKYRLSIPDAATAFPKPCCYQLELRAYKRTIVSCGSTDHRNLTEYSIGVGIC